MMWDDNYDGPCTGYVTYAKAPMMLSMLGAIVGDSAVQRAMTPTRRPGASSTRRRGTSCSR